MAIRWKPKPYFTLRLLGSRTRTHRYPWHRSGRRTCLIQETVQIFGLNCCRHTNRRCGMRHSHFCRIERCMCVVTLDSTRSKNIHRTFWRKGCVFQMFFLFWNLVDFNGPQDAGGQNTSTPSLLSCHATKTQGTPTPHLWAQTGQRSEDTRSL